MRGAAAAFSTLDVAGAAAIEPSSIASRDTLRPAHLWWRTSFPPLNAPGQRLGRDITWADLLPLHVEPAPIPKQRPPPRVRHPYLDAELPARVVVPLVDAGYAREEQGKTNGNRALVEALLARAQPQPAAPARLQRDVHGQVLVRWL